MKSTALMRRLEAAYTRAGRLYLVHCDLLYQCDLDCHHCYLDHKGTRNRDTAFWHDVIDQLGDMEVVQLGLSGGELFLRSDLLELIAHARQRGLLVELNTHGGLIGSYEASRLAELGVSEVQVSYYSPDPEVHDSITRRPGSHEATLRGIKLLKAHGVQVKAAFCAMGPNVQDLAATRAQARDLDVDLSVNGRVMDAIGGSLYPRDMAISQEQAIELGDYLFDPESHCTSAGADASWEEGAPCGAGRTSLYINPEGQVMPCLAWPQVVGDLTRGDRLSDIWAGLPSVEAMHNSTLEDARAFRNSDRQGCSECDSLSSCSYCPGHAYVEHGDPGQPATTVCNDGYVQATVLARRLGSPDPAPPPSAGCGSLFPVVTTAQVEAASPS